ncbi:hypothetical protein GALMADRAFT_109484 [Galerina marginata CBS 339.88]|uniref:Uncharacterized protein n=1 Tax=Galerina marginata (strain CBS 339.88) TaxID=685588 RepID=A0A067TRZ1_GALM3|nr:hypothetical protein GALMADRAFT_109484 [Galerina marginata CBS 339.88]
MDPPTFPYTDAQLEEAGLTGDNLTEQAAEIIATMRMRPDLLHLSIFVLQCVNKSSKRKGRGSHGSSNSLTVSDVPAESSNPPTPARDAPAVSQYTPDDYERTSYYNGIAEGGDHPELVYRSDMFTTPFPKPIGDAPRIPVKSACGLSSTPLKGIWTTVCPEILDLIEAAGIKWSSLDPACFFTRGLPGDLAKKGVFGPVVIWIGVIPGSTSAEAAHNASQEILELLRKKGVEDVVLEWRESEVRRLGDGW